MPCASICSVHLLWFSSLIAVVLLPMLLYLSPDCMSVNMPLKGCVQNLMMPYTLCTRHFMYKSCICSNEAQMIFLLLLLFALIPLSLSSSFTKRGRDAVSENAPNGAFFKKKERIKKPWLERGAPPSSACGGREGAVGPSWWQLWCLWRSAHPSDVSQELGAHGTSPPLHTLGSKANVVHW